MQRSPYGRKGGRLKQLLTWHRVGIVGQVLANKLGDHAVDAKGRSCRNEGCNEDHKKEHEAHTMRTSDEAWTLLGGKQATRQAAKDFLLLS